MAQASTARAAANGKGRHLVEGIREDLESAATKAGAVVRAGIHAGEERVKHFAEGAGERAERAHETLSESVSERPLAFLGGAAALGAVIGLLLARR